MEARDAIAWETAGLARATRSGIERRRVDHVAHVLRGGDLGAEALRSVRRPRRLAAIVADGAHHLRGSRSCARAAWNGNGNLAVETAAVANRAIARRATEYRGSGTQPDVVG